MEKVTVNFNDLENIKQSEKRKAQLENQGYSLIKTQNVGFDKFVMCYEKQRKLVLNELQETNKTM